MPAQFLPVIIATLNLMVLSVLGFYLWALEKERKKLDKREKELADKEVKLESGYQQIFDSTLEKEKKVLDNAIQKASSILSDTQYLSSASKDNLDKALEKMITDVQSLAASSSGDITTNYKNFLNRVSETTLNNFQEATKKFEADMQKEMQTLRQSLVPKIQKELEDYKEQRLKEADKKINTIVQRVSEKVLNKAIPLEDHQKLIIESLEKSRKDGTFD